MRLKIIRLIFYFGFLLLIWTLFYHQVIQGEYYHRLSKNNRVRVVPLEAKRGSIYDRNGEALAQSRLSYDVFIIPQDVDNLDDMIGFLGQVLHQDPVKLQKVYHSRRLNPFTPVVLAENLTREQIFAIEEERFRFPGLWIEQGFQRVYPAGESAAHVVGYVGKITAAEHSQMKDYGISQLSLIGKDGVEKYYDRRLNGNEGGMQVEVNSRGEQVRFLGVHDPAPGDDLILTIDRRIQDAATQALANRVGAVIVMDSDNGEILAMTSAPTFDPNAFGNRSKSDSISEWFSDERAPLINRAVRGQFPPGSLFKVIMAIAALNENVIDPRKTFFCDGSYELGKRKFGCTHRHGSENMFQALAHSCNIYFYNLVQLMRLDQVQRYARMFGLGDLTGIDLPYEADGFVPSQRQKALRGDDPWMPGDLLNYSIGQGSLLATPLQMVTMMGAVSRDGVVVKPHVVQKIGGKIVTDFLTEEKIPVSSDIFHEVHQGLHAVVEDNSGTARVLQIEGLEISGKTGTAQSSGHKADHSWFAGYAQGSVRKITFCVFLEHGGSSYNACVLAKEILLKMMDLKIL